MIYDDCDEMVTMVNVVVMVGGGAKPEDNGEDDDKILSRCLELYKSGGQCWAGSDPEPRTWLKQLRHQAFEIPLHNHYHHQ